MPTIPTLIVAPAAIAAALAYKFTGSEERGRNRIQDSQEYYVRGRSSRRGSGDARLEQQSLDDEDDARSQMQHTNKFIPTSMVGPGVAHYPGSMTNSLAVQTGESKYHAAKFDRPPPIDSYHPQGMSTKEVPERIIGPFPRSDEERKQSSWLSRAAHKLTGDLGPIEHQNDKILQERDRIRETSEHSPAITGHPRPQLHKTSMYASDAPLNKASRAADDVTRQGVKDVDANQAAINVTREGARGDNDNGEFKGWFWSKKENANSTVDKAQRRASDAADTASSWFSSKKQDAEEASSDAASAVKRRASDAADSAKEAADKTSGWFWDKKQDVDHAASEAADSAKEAADNTSGWFWNKKQDVSEQTRSAAESARQGAAGAAHSAKQGASDAAASVQQGVSEAAGSIKHGAAGAADSMHQAGLDSASWLQDKKEEAGKAVSDAAESTRQTADDARGWFWNKKQQADETVSDTADAVKKQASDAVDSAKQAADDTRGWFSSKKQQANEAVSDTADAVNERASNAVDSAKQAADETRGWFSSKKQQADKTAGEMADSVHQTADDMRDWMHETKDNAEESVRQTADDAQGWLRDQKAGAENTAAEARDWLAGKTDDLGRSVENTAASARDTAARTGDKSRAWLWEKKSEADQAIAGAAGSVERSAYDSGVRAQMHADAARDSAMDRTPGFGSSGDKSWSERRDSAMELPETKDAANSVMHALDTKFDEARAALRNTGEDLRAMAEHAVPQPTKEGLVSADGSGMRSVGGIDGTSASTADNRAAAGERVSAKFVENRSGIPVLSSTRS